MNTPESIVNFMLQHDEFSQWLGIRLEKIERNACSLSMIVRPEMLNGFNILHGGICFSLADSALAFAANSTGKQSLSTDTSIVHHQKVENGEVLKAQASLIFEGKRFSTYQVLIFNAKEDLVASFKGNVYHTQKIWEN